MRNDTRSERLHDVLLDLSCVLAAERRALITLDGAGIDDAAVAKERLDAELRHHLGEAIDAELAPLLLRVRSAARENQLLVAHARATVRDALALATGDLGGRRGSGPAIRLDVKG